MYGLGHTETETHTHKHMVYVFVCAFAFAVGLRGDIRVTHSCMLDLPDQGPYSYLFAYARNLRTPKLCARKNGILSSGLLTCDNFQTCVRKKSFSCVRKQIFGILTCLAYAKSHATML